MDFITRQIQPEINNSKPPWADINYCLAQENSQATYVCFDMESSTSANW